MIKRNSTDNDPGDKKSFLILMTHFGKKYPYQFLKVKPSLNNLFYPSAYGNSSQLANEVTISERRIELWCLQMAQAYLFV